MRRYCIPLLSAFILSATLDALPTGLQVTSGKADLHISSPEAIEILADHLSVLNWQEFSIEANEKVTFIQPQSSSCVLNKVLGGNPSQILGAMQANGKVLLINHKGVFFGKDAQVDVGSLLASTLDLKDEVFFRGEALVFEGESDGSVVNLGTIRTADGDLLLISKDIDHSGFAEVQNGSLGLIGARKVIVQPDPNQRILIKTSFSSLNGENSSFSAAFTHEENGDALVFDGEHLCTVSVSGTLKNQGGLAFVLGDEIDLRAGSFVDVSAPLGGGRVVIGGNEAREHQNTQRISIHPQAFVSASAIESGNGGDVLIWAKQATSFYGNVESEGGRSQGNGGFVEVSGFYSLDYQGIVSTNAPFGQTGTLLLDPLDLTISAAASANVSAPPPAAFLASAPTAVGANLLNTALQTALASNNVVVQTTGTVGAQLGNIAVTAPISWSPAAGTTLTLAAAGSITINRAIQESSVSTTGGVILIAAGNILIAPVGGNANVGSLNGITMVGDPALLRCNRSRPNFTLQSTATNVAQIGFFNPATNPQGSIDVTCGVLSVVAGGGVQASAQIGHGFLTTAAATGLTTFSTATITVDATGDITLQSGGPNSVGQIGHGNFNLAPATSVLLGDICVTTAANIFLYAKSLTANPRAQIGHGGTFGAFTTANGKVAVKAGQDIHMETLARGAVSIGHYAQTVVAMTSMIGDVNIFCGNDFFVDQQGSPSAVYIGNGSLAVAPIPTMTSNLTLSVGRDLTITQNGAGVTRSYIGANTTALIGNIQIAVGRDFTFTSTLSGLIPFNFGYTGNAGANNTYLAVGRNLSMNSPSGYLYSVQAPNDLNIAVGGNVDFNTAGPGIRIVSSLNAAAGTTRIWAGGYINTHTALVSVGTSGRAIDLRAGTDIQIFNGFNALTGSIFLGVGTPFAASDLWVGGAAQLASVCLQAIPLLGADTCSRCTVVPFSLTTPSAAIAAQCGNFLLPAQTFTTTSGPITLASACNNCVGQTLDIGLGGDIQISTVSGSIDVLSFYDINLNQALTTTTGSIGFSACNNLNINQLVQTTTGPISLFADSDDSGAGDLTISANVTTNGGNICLAAGAGAFRCGASLDNCVSGFVDFGASSVIQTAGTISSGAGLITLSAFRDISINGAATSILTTSGPIALTALSGNIGVLRSIASASGPITFYAGNNTTFTGPLTVITAGEIRMITGNNMDLTGAVTLSSTANSVTLVVDADFPALPLRGTGAFTMDAAAAITTGGGQPLRIFTSEQGLNSIGGTFNLNGTTFIAGTLFADTAQEVWCTYFSCPSPYPFSGLGAPFTVFYKNCLQPVTNQATIIIEQLFFALDTFNNINWPYYGVNEYYGWPTKFFVSYDRFSLLSGYQDWPSERYFLRKHNDLLLAPRTDGERSYQR